MKSKTTFVSKIKLALIYIISIIIIILLIDRAFNSIQINKYSFYDSLPNVKLNASSIADKAPHIPGQQEAHVQPAYTEWQQLLVDGGIDLKEQTYVDYIAFKESTFDYTAINDETGAIGIFQLNPHWHEIPPYYKELPVVQVVWANKYMSDRYGTWQDAYLFHKENGWW